MKVHGIDEFAIPGHFGHLVFPVDEEDHINLYCPKHQQVEITMCCLPLRATKVMFVARNLALCCFIVNWVHHLFADNAVKLTQVIQRIFVLCGDFDEPLEVLCQKGQITFHKPHRRNFDFSLIGIRAVFLPNNSYASSMLFNLVFFMIFHFL